MTIFLIFPLSILSLQFPLNFSFLFSCSTYHIFLPLGDISSTIRIYHVLIISSLLNEPSWIDSALIDTPNIPFYTLIQLKLGSLQGIPYLIDTSKCMRAWPSQKLVSIVCMSLGYMRSQYQQSLLWLTFNCLCQHIRASLHFPGLPPPTRKQCLIQHPFIRPFTRNPFVTSRTFHIRKTANRRVSVDTNDRVIS